MEHLNVSSSNPNTNGCGSDACPCSIITIIKDESQSDRRTSMKPRIPKVPQVLRDIKDHNKCFDPVVLSIGPYHHGKPELEMVQNLKIACAKQFVSGCDLNNFCSKVKVVATTAKDYYDWSTIEQRSDEEFARMIFLDGCFILHFIDCCINGTHSELDKHINILSFIWRDLFLLENQLPYVVLEALILSLKDKEKWGEMVEKWIDSCVSAQDSYSSEDGAESNGQQQDLHHQSMEVEGDDQLQPLLQQSNRDGGDDPQQPLHLLDLFWTKVVGSRDDADRSSLSPSEFLKWNSYPSIKELMAVGINIKKSKTSRLNDINFERTMFGAELSLPQMVIRNHTREKFLNLVAYERSKDMDACCLSVSSYLYFMDTLIDDADDVKKLRSKRILYNCLGTNDQVADIFNKLAVGLVPNSDAYPQVISGIHEYYKSKMRVSIGEFVHSHFSGPWSIIATIAASITILLTFLTSIFSLLSYLKVV